MKVLKIAMLLNLFVSFSYASICGESDRSLMFCKDPKAFICQGVKAAGEKSLKRNLKTIRDYTLELFFEANKEILERQGIYQIDEKAFDKLEQLIVQCHETEAEILGVCEGSNFFGMDVESLYSSTQGQKTTFKEQFLIDLEISFMDTIDEIAYRNEEKLEDISIGMMGHYKDAIKDELKSFFHFQPEKAKSEFAKVERKLDSVVFIFSRKSDKLSLFSTSEQTKIVNDYDQICGTFSDNDNAFAMHDVNGTQSVMIICPGAYLRQDLSNALDFDTLDLLPRISGTIFHELSHFLNTDSSYALSGFVRGSQNYGLEKCQKDNFKLSTPLRNNYSAFRVEIEADAFGNIAFGKYLQSTNLSVDQKLDLMKIAYSDICGTTDTVPHPGEDFRLNELLLRTPEIFHQFKCYRAYENTPMIGCSISGQKFLNLAF